MILLILSASLEPPAGRAPRAAMSSACHRPFSILNPCPNCFRTPHSTFRNEKACLNSPARYDARHSVMGFEANTCRIRIIPKLKAESGDSAPIVVYASGCAADVKTRLSTFFNLVKAHRQICGNSIQQSQIPNRRRASRNWVPIYKICRSVKNDFAMA